VREGVITADREGRPYVVVPVSLYLDFFYQLQQGLVGVVQLRPDGHGGWCLDLAENVPMLSADARPAEEESDEQAE
jgi:hypothetical protein